MQAIEAWKAKAEGRAHIDYGFHVIVSDAADETLAEMPRLVAAGYPSVKVFMINEFGIGDEALLRLFGAARAAGAIVNVHAENGDMLDHCARGMRAAGRLDPRYYAESRPALAEAEATRRAIDYAALVGAEVYIVHLSCAAALEAVSAGRRRGHTGVGRDTADLPRPDRGALRGGGHRGGEVHRGAATPVRSRSGRALGRPALGRHPGHRQRQYSWTVEQKAAGARDFTRVPYGVPGLETEMRVIYSEGVTKGRISLQTFVAAFSTNPARIFGLYPRKGTIAVGSDADFVLFDPARQSVVDERRLHSRAGYDPFHGFHLAGAPVMTVSRGEIVARDGQLAEPGGPRAAPRAAPDPRSRVSHHHLPANDSTVHWGYFSKNLKPLVEVELRRLRHDRDADPPRQRRLRAHDQGRPRRRERLLLGQEAQGRRPARRRADGRLARSAAARARAWACTSAPARSPSRGASPATCWRCASSTSRPRPCANPKYPGKSFGSNAAAWWGFHYNDLLEEPKPREVITIYEVDATGERNWAKAVYNFRWTPQTDPFGVVHKTIDYPGVPVDHRTVQENHGVLKNVRIPIRPHFGVMGLAPAEADMVDSIPPELHRRQHRQLAHRQGRDDVLPGRRAGALFSAGDPHASQGDSELCGTAIECSLTGHVPAHPAQAGDARGHRRSRARTTRCWRRRTSGSCTASAFPTTWPSSGPTRSREIYAKSSVDLALRDAFRKMRHFLMTTQGLSEDEAISLMSVAVDFGVTQVVDGNWGVHAIVKKALFAGRYD